MSGSQMGRESFRLAREAFERSAMEAEVSLSGEYRGAHAKVAGRCASGHAINADPHSIRKGQGWCRTCRYGYDRVYLVSKVIRDELWYKIGVSGRDRRVADHEYYGWSAVAEWWSADPMEHERGILALLDTERKILTPADMPQHGSGETFRRMDMLR